MNSERIEKIRDSAFEKSAAARLIGDPHRDLYEMLGILADAILQVPTIGEAIAKAGGDGA